MNSGRDRVGPPWVQPDASTSLRRGTAIAPRDG